MGGAALLRGVLLIRPSAFQASSVFLFVAGRGGSLFRPPVTHLLFLSPESVSHTACLSQDSDGASRCQLSSCCSTSTPGLSFLRFLHLQETQLVQGKVIFICETCCRTDRVKEDEKHVFRTYKILKEDKIIKQDDISCQTSERQQCGRMHDSLLHEHTHPQLCFRNTLSSPCGG